MEPTPAQMDLLRIVAQLETPDRRAGTRAVGERLLALWKERGDTHSWDSRPPWHGTNPYADELRNEELLDVDPGMSEPQSVGQPAATPSEYWLRLTDAGRQALAKQGPN